MKFEVVVIESERGWGQKVAWKKTFTSADEAYRYQESINNENTDTVAPDWYMMAMEPKRIE